MVLRFVAVGDGGSILVSATLLWLANPAAASNGFQLPLNGQPGSVSRIQAAADAASPVWSDIGVVTNADELAGFLIPHATASTNAFYRIATD